MSSKKYVLDGAMVQCNQGYVPAKLLVTENQKVKIQGKFKATDSDVQIPQTFGQCKLKPTSGGHLPCIPALQKWTKTSKSTTLGGSKTFLFEDSECMCSTGGKVTILQGLQVHVGGSAQAQFKQIAMAMPGAMMGNENIPKIVETYWMDAEGNTQIDQMLYGEKANIYVLTEHMDAGTPIRIKVKEENGKSIDGKQKTLTFAGTVKADGTAKLQRLETEENWNETTANNA